MLHQDLQKNTLLHSVQILAEQRQHNLVQEVTLILPNTKIHLDDQGIFQDTVQGKIGMILQVQGHFQDIFYGINLLYVHQ